MEKFKVTLTAEERTALERSGFRRQSRRTQAYPRSHSDAVEKQLIQLACSDPPQGRCCWTLELLADRLVALGWVKAVSREAVRRALKKKGSSGGSARRG